MLGSDDIDEKSVEDPDEIRARLAKKKLKVRRRKERAFYKYMKYSYEQKLLLL